MITAKIDAALFHLLMKLVGKVLDEVTLRWTGEGLRIRELDYGEVAMVDAFLPKECFEEYDIAEDTKITIKVSDAKILSKKPKKGTVLKLAQSDQRLTLDIGGMAMSIPTFNSDAKDLPLPKVDFRQRFLTRPKALVEFLKEAVKVNDTLCLITNGRTLMLQVKGDVTELSKILTDEEGTLLDYELRDGRNGSYDLNRLVKMVDGSFETVVVEFDKDMPMKLTYSLSAIRDITSYGSEAVVTYYLAPKIGWDEPEAKEPVEEQKEKTATDTWNEVNRFREQVTQDPEPTVEEQPKVEEEKPTEPVVVEAAKQEEPKPVEAEAVDPLEAFRNRWSRK
jgi:proliferating cell nuclear antigen